MNTRLYVGNLPYSVDEEQLRELFGKAGAVTDVAVITDRETGRSKGFGFVTMASADDATKAISQFNGYAMGNRNLTVNEARPREERSGGGGGGGGGYGGGGRGGSGGGRRERY
ncbi:MAG: RNA recognition motif domain-containing protein [Aggregatilineales bacterium]